MVKPQAHCLAVLGLLATLSCGGNVGTLEISIVRSPQADQDPLANARFVRISVEGPDGEVRVAPEQFDRSSLEGTISEVPVGNDQVVVVEGLNTEGDPISRGSTVPMSITDGMTQIELYMGLIGRFSFAPVPMMTGRAFHTATVVGQQPLILIGGTVTAWHPATTAETVVATPTLSIERLDPNAYRFAAVDCASGEGECLQAARLEHSATLLPSGNILVAGGTSEMSADGEPIASAEVFDTTANRFFLNPSEMLQARKAHRGAVSGNDALHVGGKRGTSALQEVEAFQSDGQFTAAPSLRSERHSFTLTALADGSLVATGGIASLGNTLTTCELLPPNPTQWIELTSATMNTARAHHTATLLEDGSIILVGGINDTASVQPAPVPTVERLHVDASSPGTSSIDRLPNLREARWSHSATLMPDGTLWVIGGFGTARADAPLDTVEEISFTSSGGVNVRRLPIRLNQPRAGHRASLLPSGVLIVSGGVTLDGGSPTIADTAEVLIP